MRRAINRVRMSAQAQMRALLDQLMGTSRDGECKLRANGSERISEGRALRLAQTRK